MDFRQQLYYGILLRSIKSEFNHTAFSKLFPFNPDFVLVMLLEAFAEAKADNWIVCKLHTTLSQRGFDWFKGDIYEFIQDKSHRFRKEIATASLMEDMLEIGFPEAQILDLVSKLCGGRKPLHVIE